jgi:hypothetical protein
VTDSCFATPWPSHTHVLCALSSLTCAHFPPCACDATRYNVTGNVIDNNDGHDNHHFGNIGIQGYNMGSLTDSNFWGVPAPFNITAGKHTIVCARHLAYRATWIAHMRTLQGLPLCVRATRSTIMCTTLGLRACAHS